MMKASQRWDEGMNLVDRSMGCTLLSTLEGREDPLFFRAVKQICCCRCSELLCV